MRERILNEIRRVAKENGGKPVGRQAFEKITGIRQADWFGIYWARWGDAVTEAGLRPNALQSKLDEGFVLQKVAEAYRHYGRVATYGELRLYAKRDAAFPSHTTIANHYRTQVNLGSAVRGWAEGRENFADVVRLYPPLRNRQHQRHIGTPNLLMELCIF